jgi:hypothetical protein
MILQNSISMHKGDMWEQITLVMLNLANRYRSVVSIAICSTNGEALLLTELVLVPGFMEILLNYAKCNALSHLGWGYLYYLSSLFLNKLISH